MPRQLPVSTAYFLPERRTLPSLREATQHCKGCDLWKRGTQAVFGEGSPGAEVMLVGEQPGDQEDLQGRPFVGPAGKLLDKTLEAAGIDRDDVYIINVAQHFKGGAVRQATHSQEAERNANCGQITGCRRAA